MNLLKTATFISLFLLSFAFSVFAQKDQLKIEYIVFDSSRDYLPVIGSPTMLNYDSFKKNMSLEISKKESNLIWQKEFYANLGEVNNVGSDDLLQLSDGKSSYKTQFPENIFQIAPFLIGSEDNASSNTVSFQVVYDRAQPDTSLKIKGLPSVSRIHFEVNTECKLNMLCIIGRQNDNTKQGRETYLAVYFRRP